jgi:hypothetical protein
MDNLKDLFESIRATITEIEGIVIERSLFVTRLRTNKNVEIGKLVTGAAP